MKKSKGFTLIELLAIIVILAIIAVITVPIILGIIDDAKKNSAKDSAYGYKDAVNKFYATELMSNKDFSMQDKTYTVAELRNLGVSVSGKEPKGYSWLSIQNNDVVSGCLQFVDYKVEIINGSVANAVKGECESNSPIVIVSGTRGNLQSGDVVRIGDSDEFYVIDSDNSEGGKTVLFAKHILNSADFQDSTSQYKIAFSNSRYWVDSNIQLISPYTADSYGRAYVYDSNSLVYPHIQNYVSHLKSIISINIYGRLLYLGEGNTSFRSYPNIIQTNCSNCGYWTGSAGFVQMSSRSTVNYVVCAGSGNADYNSYNSVQAIRPVIEILTSDI